MSLITCWSITILLDWVSCKNDKKVNIFHKENSKNRIRYASLDQSGALKISQASSVVKNIPALSLTSVSFLVHCVLFPVQPELAAAEHGGLLTIWGSPRNVTYFRSHLL